MSVLTPGWNSAAFVYRETSSVVSNSPKAPEPFACTVRSGTRSRLKCAIWFRKWWSCSRIGPSGPSVSEVRSLVAGAPVSVVDPRRASSDGAVAIELSVGCGRSREEVMFSTQPAVLERVKNTSGWKPGGRSVLVRPLHDRPAGGLEDQVERHHRGGRVGVDAEGVLRHGVDDEVVAVHLV